IAETFGMIAEDLRYTSLSGAVQASAGCGSFKLHSCGAVFCDLYSRAGLGVAQPCLGREISHFAGARWNWVSRVGYGIADRCVVAALWIKARDFEGDPLTVNQRCW